MYTDDDLNAAVKKGIFTEASVEAFRADISLSKHSPAVDEENFRLITSFNDIFVVIACALLLFSSYWILSQYNILLGLFVLPVLSWGLAEFFVRKRKMSLPGIVLLITFVYGVFAFFDKFLSDPGGSALIYATAIASICTYLHWLRFKVPITIAACTAVILVFLVSLLAKTFPGFNNWILLIVFILGVFTFALAMYWDAKDRERITHRSDVAFWLHLLAAPLIVHPVFSELGLLEGSETVSSLILIIILYLVLTFISVIIDRRAFMVSSLAYVIYAISNILENYGVVSSSLAITSLRLGAGLLLLSAFWHSARTVIVPRLPNSIQSSVPNID